MTQFTPEQISHMLALQDELNSLIHPEWKTQGFDWSTAIIDECQEILNWIGWKWWKGVYKCGITEDNKKQIQIEVIDILHFGLSKFMVDEETTSLNIETMSRQFNLGYEDGREDALEEVVKDIREYCANWNSFFSWTAFGELVYLVDLSPSQVYETYIGKYTLNIFRQKHGYKTGEYKKHWLLPVFSIEFQEDNWYLEKAIAEIKEAGHTVSIEEIDNRLEYWYGILEGGK